MKICPTCGLDADDRFLFCPDDGTPLDKPAAGPLPNDETSSNHGSKLVLHFCPACEGEYPLTFSLCPIDGLKLTRERVRSKKPVAVLMEVASPALIAAAPKSASAVEPLEAPIDPDLTAHYESPDELPDAMYEQTDPEPDSQAAPSVTKPGLIESFRSDRPSFQIAAVATLLGLAIFGITAIYRIYSFGASAPERPSPATTALNQQEVPPPSFFIETPKEAREYVEEEAPSQEAAPEVKMKEAAPELQPSKERPDPPPSQGQTKNDPHPPDKAAADRARAVSAPVAPQSTGGSVEARLVRVRGNRTRPGYRYDLTFTLKEQAGRAVRWNNLTVSARSASGINHLQTLPFSHRQGPSGALTFTVSVEMTGRGEPDWRGRIVCTTVGKDDSGRFTRATFGATVTP
jgi:hypothetical protein